ncbi:L-ribulokinase [Parapedobacter luteus]|uniref:Ribulokinase n=1 Tax=Parapedobacter luteus TaxID=623280 RepID=A0A1T5EK91_9SPHI|nr:ribulokinase [Parapedobacter luteus]SKB84347.1 L-ribulokinase [Parapedobacter luteus]
MDISYVIGVDFGTDSVRSVLVSTADGTEIATSVFEYPRWKAGLYCNPAQNQFRQHPLDYIEGLEYTIRSCVTQAGNTIAKNVVGISVDTTGSTPVAVDQQGMPLSLRPEFADNPNAMFVLWKDHTSVKEAAEINTHAGRFETNYLQYVGGIYSSEWFWAKLLHIFRQDEQVRQATHSWVEHCDWIPFLLCGGNHVTQIKRGVCSAGHKSLWAAEFGGFPPNDFFASLDPLLDGFTGKLPAETFTAAQGAGTLSASWAEKLGLATNVVVGIGAFDCHMGAVGGQIEPYYLSKIIGTSTCDILVAPKSEMAGKLVQGICGQVDGSVIPGMIGLEAGQSAFGDAYAWFKNLLIWPLKALMGGFDQKVSTDVAERLEKQILVELSKQAALLTPSTDSELAIDWLNGRRTPDANQLLKGAIMGIDLASDAPRLFRALVEATAFGAKKIVDRFIEQGIPVKGLIALGGIPRKSPFVMQLMADVIGMPIKVHRSEQTCAIGAAMFAATAAGVFSCVEEAMQQMGQGFDMEYHPNLQHTAIYAKRYTQYSSFGDFIETQITI